MATGESELESQNRHAVRSEHALTTNLLPIQWSGEVTNLSEYGSLTLAVTIPPMAGRTFQWSPTGTSSDSDWFDWPLTAANGSTAPSPALTTRGVYRADAGGFVRLKPGVGSGGSLYLSASTYPYTFRVEGSTASAPVFITQPSVEPSGGDIGSTFVATPGVVSNGQVTSRTWFLDGSVISDDVSAVPNAPGTMIYTETAVGPGGTAQSTPQMVEVTNPSNIFYAELDQITALGIDVPASASVVTLQRLFPDNQLKIRRKREVIISEPVTSTWLTNTLSFPIAPSGDAVSAATTLSKGGPGTVALTANRISLGKDAYLSSPPLNLSFLDTVDPATTMAPPSFRFSFKGIVPAARDRSAILGSIEQYNVGHFVLLLHDWGRRLELKYGRDSNYLFVLSDELSNDLNGALHLIEVEYLDSPNGPGGSVTFYADGAALGETKIIPIKPKLPPAALLEINASIGNTVNSVSGLQIEYIAIEYGDPIEEAQYDTIDDGPITIDDLRNLVVDARGVTSPQPARSLIYTLDGEQHELKIVVGPMPAPPGRAYRAVLEDWSTGTAVPHLNELVMTRPAAQNVRFEDDVLGSSQESWAEVLPQGPAPVLDGIVYGCEGIRQGQYVMLQFVYSFDRDSEPFGDVEGLETYMRPHKWAIYDQAGDLLDVIEKPNGEPLNAASTPVVFAGQYDGRSVAIITDNNRWYPHGTVRSSIIYRSDRPSAYSQNFILDNCPVYDLRVPFGSHANDSVNGFDQRIFVGGNGGEGQANGFANWKVMPWEPLQFTYDSIKGWVTATLDPWKYLYNDLAATPNAALHIKYTPFNSTGRSPVVGPGGTRDDRQSIAEPVAQYMRDVTAVRRHDQRPLSDIALDYLTGYASDPFHGVEKGKLTPLFKWAPRRNITLRNHYYGYGSASIPADQAFYVQSGRLYQTTTSQNPTRTTVPYAGRVDTKPYFGSFEIDASHAHQFPHWGSMLWRTPEFAMLGVSFSDQARLYENVIISSVWKPSEFSSRERAWRFLHCALLWKTASATSTRLYSRQEIMDWAVYDFEMFHDQWYTSTPGFLNPPTNIIQGGEVRANLAVLAGAPKFGPMEYVENVGLEMSEFQVGYWLSALYSAHKIGFLDALRNASQKCAEIVDFIINLHRLHVVGKLNGGMLLNPVDSDYRAQVWSQAAVLAAGGDVSALPQTYQAAAAARGPAPSWDTRTAGGNTYSRDGQAMDALLAGASILKAMGLSGTDLDEAEQQAEIYFQQKLTSEAARGPALAGSQWFKYHQTTFNRPYPA